MSNIFFTRHCDPALSAGEAILRLAGRNDEAIFLSSPSCEIPILQFINSSIHQFINFLTHDRLARKTKSHPISRSIAHFKLPENHSVWSADPDFSALVTQFRAYPYRDTRHTSPFRKKTHPASPSAKKRTPSDLEAAILKVVNAAVAHALIINDSDFLTTVDYSKSDIQGARDSALVGIATVVYDSAWPIRVALRARHITEADITLVATLRDQPFS